MNYKLPCEFRLVEFRPFHWLRKPLCFKYYSFPPQGKKNVIFGNIITLANIHEFSSIKDATEIRVQFVLECDQSPFNTVETKRKK